MAFPTQQRRPQRPQAPTQMRQPPQRSQPVRPQQGPSMGSAPQRPGGLRAPPTNNAQPMSGFGGRGGTTAPPSGGVAPPIINPDRGGTGTGTQPPITQATGAGGNVGGPGISQGDPIPGSTETQNPGSATGSATTTPQEPQDGLENFDANHEAWLASEEGRAFTENWGGDLSGLAPSGLQDAMATATGSVGGGEGEGAHGAITGTDAGSWEDTRYGLNPSGGQGGDPNDVQMDEIRDMWADMMGQPDAILDSQLEGISADEARNTRRASEMNAAMGGSVGGNLLGGQAQAQLGGEMLRSQARGEAGQRQMEIKGMVLDDMMAIAERQENEDMMRWIETERAELSREGIQAQTDIAGMNLEGQMAMAGAATGEPDGTGDTTSEAQPASDSFNTGWFDAAQEKYGDLNQQHWANSVQQVQEMSNQGLSPEEQQAALDAYWRYWDEHGNAISIPQLFEQLGYSGVGGDQFEKF